MIQYKILIVEDELIFAHEMKLWLSRRGYMVAGIVTQGEKAINSAVLLHPDLVLMDISLRGKMDGILAASHIKEIEDIPIIFLTGNPNLHDLWEEQSIKPAAVLSKPVSETQLLDTVDGLLGQKNKSYSGC